MLIIPEASQRFSLVYGRQRNADTCSLFICIMLMHLLLLIIIAETHDAQNFLLTANGSLIVNGSSRSS